MKPFITITINTDGLLAELHELAAISDCPEPPPAVTRVVFTPTDLRARAYLRTLYEAAGLRVHEDAVGNTFARWQGSDPDAAAVGTGSHCDAIPHAGMYDGTVGVLGGLEAIRALERSGYQPRRSVDVIMFTSEEPTRFGVGCTGSRLMSGAMSPAELIGLVDDTGTDYDTIRQQAGFAGELASARLSDNPYSAFVELHIEQGPELEKLLIAAQQVNGGRPTGARTTAQELQPQDSFTAQTSKMMIGAVTAIAAPATVLFTVTGEGGHAGAVLMPGRRDALAAAAQMAVAIESIARQSPSQDLVATIGQVEVYPGAVNSIPSRVRFPLDLRDTGGENRDQILAEILAAVGRIAAERGVTIEHEVLNADPPAACDPRLVRTITAAASRLGHASTTMISRAYHDSLFMARVAPTAMIFIPCRGGVSHRPDEYASPEAIGAGVATLALTLAELAE